MRVNAALLKTWMECQLFSIFLLLPTSLNGAFVDPTIFHLELNSGEVVVPKCASIAPANEPNERTTVLILGTFGDGLKGTIYPREIRIQKNLYFNVIGDILNAKGISYSNPEDMIYIGSSVRMAAANFNEPEVKDLNGCLSIYPNTTDQITITMSGGMNSNGVDHIENGEYWVFQDKEGNEMKNGVLGLADLHDHDNFWDICLDSSKIDLEKIASIRMPCEENSGTQVYPPKGRYACKTHTLSLRPGNESTSFTVSVMISALLCITIFIF